MSYPTGLSGATVAAIPELLEMILLDLTQVTVDTELNKPHERLRQLEPHALLSVVRSVSRAFYYTIRDSPSLQRRMNFEEPSMPQPVPPLNWLLENKLDLQLTQSLFWDLANPNPSLRLGTVRKTEVFIDLVTRGPDAHITKMRKFMAKSGPTASWRRLRFQQSVIMEERLSFIHAEYWRPPHQEGITWYAEPVCLDNCQRLEDVLALFAGIAQRNGQAHIQAKMRYIKHLCERVGLTTFY